MGPRARPRAPGVLRGFGLGQGPRVSDLPARRAREPRRLRHRRPGDPGRRGRRRRRRSDGPEDAFDGAPGQGRRRRNGHWRARSRKPREDKAPQQEAEGAGQEAAVPLRSNFSETAFWQPHLLTGADGSAAVEFTVPDSVTSWRVFVHGVTKDLMGGRLEKEARTVKDLMVRPYLPRFFREGDTAELRVMVNNAGDTAVFRRGRARDLRPFDEREPRPGLRPAREGPAAGRSRSKPAAARRSFSRWPRRPASARSPSR